MDCQEYKEMIAAHVDGALSLEERWGVESHLNQCSKCTQMFLWETEVKRSLKQKLSPIPLRAGLRQRLLDQLGESSKEGYLNWFYMPQGLAAAVVLLLILAVPYLIWRGKVQEDIFANTIAQYQKVTEGTINTSSLTAPAQLLDLSPWGYQVLAKQTQRVRGQEGRVFVYQGPAKEFLLAQEFEGTDISLPRGAKTIRTNRDFVSYSHGGVNLIAWREKEKDLLCILASTLPREKLLGLAQQIVTGG